MEVLHEVQVEYAFDGVGRFHPQVSLHYFGQNIVGHVLLIKLAISLVDEVYELDHFGSCLLLEPVEVLVDVSGHLIEGYYIQLWGVHYAHALEEQPDCSCEPFGNGLVIVDDVNQSIQLLLGQLLMLPHINLLNQDVEQLSCELEYIEMVSLTQ